jgi:biotin carboxylase
MIAKVIVSDETRPLAIGRMIRALTEFEIEGIPTTRDVALDVLASREFTSGSYATSTLDELVSRARSLAPG